MADTDKENEKHEELYREYEEEDTEENFEWKCRLLGIMQQYPEAFDMGKNNNRNDDTIE